MSSAWALSFPSWKHIRELGEFEYSFMEGWQISFIIRQCDLLVHSSQSEAFGLVVLEALALGVPVIAADAIGPIEIQEHLGMNDALRLVPVGDPQALAIEITQFNKSKGGKDASEELAAYVKPYSISMTVEQWVGFARQVEAMN
jgi:glycosyltransferase involved in cell wall biosynthesis